MERWEDTSTMIDLTSWPTCAESKIIRGPSCTYKLHIYNCNPGFAQIKEARAMKTGLSRWPISEKSSNMAQRDLWSSHRTLYFELIIIIIISIYVFLARSEPTHRLLCSHRLGGRVYHHRDARQSQGPMVWTDSVRGREGNYQKKLMPGAFKGRAFPVWETEF